MTKIDTVTLGAVADILRDLRQEFDGKLSKATRSDPNTLYRSILLLRMQERQAAVLRYLHELQHQRARVVKGDPLPHVQKVAG